MYRTSNAGCRERRSASRLPRREKRHRPGGRGWQQSGCRGRRGRRPGRLQRFHGLAASRDGRPGRVARGRHAHRHPVRRGVTAGPTHGADDLAQAAQLSAIGSAAVKARLPISAAIATQFVAHFDATSAPHPSLGLDVGSTRPLLRDEVPRLPNIWRLREGARPRVDNRPPSLGT